MTEFDAGWNAAIKKARSVAAFGAYSNNRGLLALLDSLMLDDDVRVEA
jgi:hypothetical protein